MGQWETYALTGEAAVKSPNESEGGSPPGASWKSAKSAKSSDSLLSLFTSCGPVVAAVSIGGKKTKWVRYRNNGSEARFDSYKH